MYFKTFVPVFLFPPAGKCLPRLDRKERAGVFGTA
jgi:hypothetical protein